MRYISLIVVISLIPATGCSRTSGAETQAPGTDANITIRPGEQLSASELASVLGVYVWKFEVSTPDDAKVLYASLEQQEKEQEIKPFVGRCGSTVTPASSHQLLVAMVPIGGTMTDAEKVRIMLGGVSTTVENPLKGCAGISTGPPASKGVDSPFALIGGYKGRSAGPAADGDKVIWLKIDTHASE